VLFQLGLSLNLLGEPSLNFSDFVFYVFDLLVSGTEVLMLLGGFKGGFIFG